MWFGLGRGRGWAEVGAGLRAEIGLMVVSVRVGLGAEVSIEVGHS